MNKNNEQVFRKIRNPFTIHKGFNCFGCSPDNPIGLQLNFIDHGDFITANWQPQTNYQGYHNLLHGGIQATLLDEIASWFVNVKLKTAGVTSKIEIKYKKTVYVDSGPIMLKATLIRLMRNIADIKVELFNDEKQLCAVGVAQYFTFSEKIAKEKYYYPEPNKFYFEKD